MDIESYFLTYLDLGFSVIPLLPRSKTPAITWKEFQSRKATPEEISSWVTQFPDCGIGIVTGAISGISVLDADGADGEAQLSTLGVDRNFSVKTAKGIHVYCAYTPELKSAVRAAPQLDIQNDGKYVVAPPSIHESGHIYTWQNGTPGNISDLPDAPVAVISLLNQNGTTKKFADKLPDILREGEGRNNALHSLCGSMRRRGASFEAMLAAIKVENQRICKPPLPDQDLARIATSALKYVQDLPNSMPSGDDYELSTIARNSSQWTPKIGHEVIHNSSFLPYREKELFGYSSLGIKSEILLSMDDAILPPHLAENFVFEESCLIIGAPPGYGKSWLLLDLAISLASGSKWLGKFETTKIPVAFIDEENGIALTRSRYRSMLDGKKIDNHAIPIEFSFGVGPMFSRKESLDTLLKLVEKQKPKVIIIDSLVRAHTAEENSATAMAQVFSIVKDLIRTFGVAIVFSDHHRKPPLMGVSAQENMLRGSSEKLAFIDNYLSMRKEGDIFIVDHLKSRYAKATESFGVRLVGDMPAPVSIERLDDPTEAIDAESMRVAEKFILDLLGSLGQVENKRIEIEARKSKLSLKAIREAKAELEITGKVTRVRGVPNKSGSGNHTEFRLSSGHKNAAPSLPVASQIILVTEPRYTQDDVRNDLGY